MIRTPDIETMMGSAAEIPSAAAPGKLAIDITLVGGDLQLAVDKLKAALDEAKRRAASPVPPPALPVAAMASLSLSLSGQPAQASAAPPVLQQPVRQAAAPAEAPASFWDLCGATDPADHCRDPIASMTYTPAIEGLPGGSGHAGWLFTASRGLLQLWECSPSGGRGEAPLLMMHSQAIDYLPVCMEVERATQALLAACTGRGGEEWVGLHSLQVEQLLAVKGKAPMPHQASQRRQGQNCLAATSLHSFGGPLREHCAASYGGGIVVWGVGSAARPIAAPQQPRGVWKAHDSLITTLHRSAFGVRLLSGAADGSAHLWDLKIKPAAPLAAFRHGGRVAGLHQVNDDTVLAAAGDRLTLWDLRNASKALGSVAPGGGQIARLAISPFGDSAAVATAKGLYAVDLLDAGLPVAPIIAGAPPSKVTQLTYNVATAEVLCGCEDGCIRVYRQRVPHY